MNYNYTAFQSRFTQAIQKNLHNYKRNEVIRLACELLRRFQPYQQQQSINIWVSDYKLSRYTLENYLEGDTVKQVEEISPNEELRNFLSEFSIQQNVISGEFSIIRDAKSYTMEELQLLCEDSKISTRNLHKFINPENVNITITDLYNPLKELLVKLADNYRGEKVIEQLCTYLVAHNFADKQDENHYKTQLDYYFHKWLCIAAGMALGITTNDVMLLWVDPKGGTGKSYLNRWLFSLPEFASYYLRIGENESFMDMKGISKAKFVVDFDELPISKKRYLAFKSNIAATDGQEYSKSNKKYNSYKRVVNYVGSTNKANRAGQPGYLIEDDAAMRRRILPLEITGKLNYNPETDGYMKLNLYQLWGQAAFEILQAQKDGNTNYLTWETDHEKLREMNMRYIDSGTVGCEFEILRRFPRGTYGDMVVQPSQIIESLRRDGIKVSMSEWQLGRFLSEQNYTHGRRGNIRGWFVGIK